MAKKENEKRQVFQIKRAEHEAQLAVLRQIRDNPAAATSERLEAVKLIMEMEKN